MIPFSFLTSLILSWTSPAADEPKIFISDKLVQKWETPHELKTPESVYYDESNRVIYVSNINGNPTDKDGNGFISVLELNGKIRKLEWVKGLDAPKGMGVYKEKLYVTDIDKIVEVNMHTGEIVHRYPVEGSGFLNDISIDKTGNVYVSDTKTSTIYVLSDGKVSTWSHSDKFVSANGLRIEKDTLLVGAKDELLAVSLKDKSILTLIKNTGSIDGLIPDGKGNYFISDWSGNVNLISTKHDKQLLLNTSPLKINAADMEYIPSSHLLLIPTFFDNRVVAYEVKE